MTVTFEEVTGGTEVTLTFENLPPGLRAEDNEAGAPRPGAAGPPLRMTDGAFRGTRSPIRRSARGEINQWEAFLPRRIGEALIERDDFERRGTAFRGYEARCQPQCVGRPQRVNAKKSRRARGRPGPIRIRPGCLHHRSSTTSS